MKKATNMRTPILMAFLVTAFALPAGAATHPVKGAAHGTATAGKSVVQGAGQAGREHCTWNGYCGPWSGPGRGLSIYARHALQIVTFVAP